MAIENLNIYLRLLATNSRVKYARGILWEWRTRNRITQVVGELRRSANTAASILPESGASLSTLEAADGWRSSTVADHYIVNTDCARLTAARALAPTAEAEHANEYSEIATRLESLVLQNLHINNFANIVININGGPVNISTTWLD
jgi:hypothetical protein